MIVQFFVSEGQGVDALPEQMHQVTFGGVRIATAGKRLCKSLGYFKSMVHLSQKRCSSVGREPSFIEGYLQPAARKGEALCRYSRPGKRRKPLSPQSGVRRVGLTLLRKL